MKRITALILSCLTLALTSAAIAAPPFSSNKGQEHQVTFRGILLTEETDPSVFATYTESQKSSFTNRNLLHTLDYVFGPLTTRELGATKRVQTATIDWASAKVGSLGKVELGYDYQGTWILEKSLAQQVQFDLPMPYNQNVVFTENWKNCSDSAPDHQTESFFWYFWDPTRYGCDHVEGQQFYTTTVLIGDETVNQAKTYPEYSKMVETLADGSKKLSMTIGFGYVEDANPPKPDTDSDYGMSAYRSFLSQFRKEFKTFKESNLLQSEYKSATSPNTVIGRRFIGTVGNTKVEIKVVTSGGIDQMELFAKSFAHDHDALWAWFGHSRVGSGFDADNFKWMVQADPAYYSISDRYQVIYWGGCNSYSYYSMPFFKFKQKAGIDPNGTKRLDIIANGLPSLFSLNAGNAMITARAFIQAQAGGQLSSQMSYQDILAQIEGAAENQGTLVLTNVLGDEDNAL